MSRRRVLTDEQAIAAEVWFSNFQRIGTVDEKCRELGISEDALRDAVRRVRKQDVRNQRRKLSHDEISQLVDGISRGTQEIA